MNQGDYSAKVVESPVREGKYAIRFEWRAENFKGSNVSKKASLFSGREPTAKEERWWGFSLYLPAQGMEKDSQSEILAQWHETPDKGEPWRNPPLTLSHNGGNLQVSWLYDRRKITPPPPWKWDRTTVKIGPAPKDRWIDWVWHIKWDPFGKGVLEVWMDGKKVVDARDISIGMNDERGNYAGIGLYKYSGKSDHAARVIYFDEVRAGSAQATYADVAPGAKPLPQDADTRDRGPSVP